jgi:hypothetical protein
MSDEEYINVENVLKNTQKKIYQLQLDNNKIKTKHIGFGSECPDIIIKENFGKNNNLNLYNCIYQEDELNEYINNSTKTDHLFPLIRLVKNDNNIIMIYSIVIKFNEVINYDNDIKLFEIYFVYNKKNNEIINKKLLYDINPDNIIEKLLENIIDLEEIIL